MKQVNEHREQNTHTHTHTHTGSALKFAIRTLNSSRGASAIKRDMIQEFYILFFLRLMMKRERNHFSLPSFLDQFTSVK